MRLFKILAFVALGALAGSAAAKPRRNAVAHAAAPAADVLARATAAANAALVEAYAKAPPALAPPHPGPWVTASGAQVKGDAKHGFSFHWEEHPAAGWDHDVTVVVDAAGKLQVKRADAFFSPE
jgi:hypothetical protein